MRFLVSLATLLLPLAASAAPAASDPAFLGITMDHGPGYCSIRLITTASPAQEAGLMFGDMITAIDGQPLAGNRPCDQLQAQIVSHRPGEEIKLDLRRGAQRMKLTATLSTRGEVLYRRLVGESAMHTELIDLDNAKVSYDLASRGRTTIVGWFLLESCSNCARAFDRISDGLTKRLKDSDGRPLTLAVTPPGRRADLKDLRASFTSNVSLAVADPDLFESYALSDADRVNIMVIDCRGVIRYIKPVAPDADDLDAAVDDVLAAAEQAEHQRTSRRN